MKGYTIEEKKIHESIYFFIDQCLANPILKQRILQYATNEILNQISDIINTLESLLSDEGLRHDQFQLLDLCKDTNDFLIALIMNCGYSQYRRKE